jgi:aspartate aminotransferase
MAVHKRRQVLNEIFSTRMESISPSLTLSLQSKANEMKSQGLEVFSFAAGEPNFNTAKYICEAAKKALDEGKTKYGPAAGEKHLRELVAKEVSTVTKSSYDFENVLITNGGKQALFNVMMALLNPQDEVLIPSPYWLSYPEMVKLAGGVPVSVPTDFEDDYKLKISKLKKYLSPKTKLLILNTPSNPTGMVYTKEELEEISKFVLENNITVVSDEIYSKLTYDKHEHLSLASLNSEISEKTILCSGFAKSYAMTGWRIGYVVGSKKLIKTLSKIQGHTTSNVCTFAQYGAMEALENTHGKESLQEMQKVFLERKSLIYNLVSNIKGLKTIEPQGAFYLYVNIKETGLDSLIFCERLLEEKHVVLVPGKVFGDNDAVRISFATSEEVIRKGMEKLKDFVENL